MSKPIDESVEVIIPNRSRWDLLERLLESLESQEPRPRICVVDNASTDASVEQLERRDGVRLCALGENVGFGRAINHGARSSEAEFVIFVNNDMVVEPGFVSAILERLAAARCAVSAKQLRPDGSIDSIGVTIDDALNAYDAGHGAPADQATSFASSVAGPSGGAAGFRRADFLAIGGYDEAIFAYLEDVDLAIQLRAESIESVYCDAAVVTHHHSMTLGSGSSAKNELLGWSRGYLLWKYRRSLSRPARVKGLVVDAIVYAGQLVIDRNVGSLRGRLRFRRERSSHAQRDRLDLPIQAISLGESLRRRARRR